MDIVINFLLKQQASPSLLFVVSSIMGLAAALVVSANRSEIIRSCVLMLLGVGFLLVALYAVTIFQVNNTLYSTFFLNLSTEFFGALLLFFSFELYSGELNFKDFLWLLLLLAVSFIPDFAPESFFQAIAHNSDFTYGFVQNIAVEAFSTVIIVLLSILFTKVIFCPDLPTHHNVMRTVLVGCVAFDVALMMFVLIGMGWLNVEIDSAFTQQVVIGLVGALITTAIFGSWLTTQNWLFPIACILVIWLASTLLFEINNSDTTLSMSFSTELFGALIATVLLERQWFWGK